MKTKKRGLILIVVGLLCITAALFLIAYNFIDEKRAERFVSDALLKLEEQINDYEEKDSHQATAMPTPNETLLPEEVEYPDYIINPEMDMPTKEIEGNEYIGILSIPSLELELPIMSEWSYSKLKEAPCRYDGSVYLNDLIIAAHNYKRHFGSIKNLQEGDEIVFTDIDSNVFRYEIVLVETLMPTDIELMKAEEWDLTLFTCTKGGSYRVTVRCMLLGAEGI